MSGPNFTAMTNTCIDNDPINAIQFGIKFGKYAKYGIGVIDVEGFELEILSVALYASSYVAL